MTTASQARLLTALALIVSSYGFVAPVSVGAVRSLGAPPAGGQRTAILTSRKRQRMATGAGSGLRMQENDGTDALDRFVACLPYALPLADSFEWGHYIFDSFPLAAIPFLPLFPVIKLLNMPFVSFGIFIVLFNFVSRNPQFSRLVRFNTLQAIYLDVVLIFPQLLRGIVGPTNQFIPQGLAETGANTVFYAILFGSIYSIVSNIGGKTPNEIPIISEAVDSQMPF